MGAAARMREVIDHEELAKVIAYMQQSVLRGYTIYFDTSGFKYAVIAQIKKGNRSLDWLIQNKHFRISSVAVRELEGISNIEHISLPVRTKIKWYVHQFRKNVAYRDCVLSEHSTVTAYTLKELSSMVSKGIALKWVQEGYDNIRSALNGRVSVGGIVDRLMRARWLTEQRAAVDLMRRKHIRPPFDEEEVRGWVEKKLMQMVRFIEGALKHGFDDLDQFNRKYVKDMEKDIIIAAQYIDHGARAFLVSHDHDLIELVAYVRGQQTTLHSSRNSL